MTIVIFQKLFFLVLFQILLCLGISHNLDTKDVNYKTEILTVNYDGKLLTEKTSLDAAALPVQNLKEWIISDSKITCSSSSSSDGPIFLQNLEKLAIYDSQLNPHCITFGDTLHSIGVRRINFTIGNISDLMRTATKLRDLQVGEIGEFDFDSFPVNSLEYIIIFEGCNIISSRNRFTFFPNLKEFTLLKSQLNPRSIVFGDQFYNLRVSAPDFVNGTIYDLIQDITTLEALEIKNISDFDMAALQAPEKLLRLRISGKNSSIWTSSAEPVHFPNLDVFSIIYGQINPYSITFSDRLTYFNFNSPILTNGSVEDLLKTATKLETIGLRSDYLNELDLAALPAKSLDYLEISGNWTVISSSKELVVFQNLSLIMISDINLNPQSFAFSPKLSVLEMYNCTLTNGTISDLLKTGTDVEILRVTNMGEIDVTSIPAKTLKNLEISVKTTMTWNNSEPIVLRNLEEFSFSGGEMNPHSIAFSDKLNTISLMKVNFINGSSYDLLRTAVNLAELTIDDIGIEDADISRLPSSETLTKLIHYSPRFHCSTQVTFQKLKTLNFPGLRQEVNESTFCNFTQTFPHLNTLFTSEEWPASPEFTLQLLQASTLTELRFLFDLNPKTKSAEFDQVVQFLLEYGLSEKLPPKFFSKQANFPESRFQYIKIRKWGKNGDSKIDLRSDSRPQKNKAAANIFPKPNLNILVFCLLSTILTFIFWSMS